jgi:2-C-methyl-D-erythritol 4-phosphate cytidylyltransferase
MLPFRAMEAGVILVAAGEGRRFGGPKAFVALEGRTLLERAAEPFASFRDRVVVARAEDLARARLPGWKVVAGGPRRRDSVERGLAALDAATEVVLVHDAARPLVPPAVVERVRAAAGRHGAVVPGIPLTDTIKRVRGERVVETLDRSALVAVQTPQGFRVDLLRRALASGGGDFTDDAAIVEGLGEPVVVVPGDPRNLKVTVPEDLPLLGALVRAGMR